MTIFKTFVGSDDGAIYTVDTIEHEGGLWLVAKWCDAKAEGLSKPMRIIRMDVLPHQKLQRKPDGLPADFVLNVPIPKAVLDCAIEYEAEPQLVVVDFPDVEPMPLKPH